MKLKLVLISSGSICRWLSASRNNYIRAVNL